MVLKADQQRVKALLTETVTLLCKNGLHFKSELSIEGLIGITLDQEEIFLVNINEVVKLNSAFVENETSLSPVEQSTFSRKCRQRQAAVEHTSAVENDVTVPSVKASIASTVEDSFSLLDPDKGSVSDQRSCSPLPTSSFPKTLSDDVTLTQPSMSPATTTVKPSEETPTSERPVSFCDVPIRLDYALGAQDTTNSNSQQHSSEPPCKKTRRQGPGQAVDSQEQGSSEPVTYETPSGSTTCKLEPSDIIEIKEESLSDEEARDSMGGYSSYQDYGIATSYGNSDLDVSQQMYGETSGFQPEAPYPADVQGAVASRSQHESPRSLKCRCDSCGLFFAKPGALSAHMSLAHHRRQKFVCGICDKVFERQRSLRGHMSSRHNAPKDFACQFCSKKFSYKWCLVKHLSSVHQYNTP